MDYKNIELKWQKVWEDNQYFLAENNSEKEKYYVLVEFPYPSGSGLHVGHVKGYSALDVIARKKRMEGYNVLFPMGWDAFGLPAEQYAILNKIHPREAVKENVKVFKEQLKKVGLSFDWSREINTTDPEYYKWTQWQFLKFYEHNRAYKAKKEINWCNNCKIGLANEEVEDNSCERCGNQVIKKEKDQWILRMSDYAEQLLEGLEETEFIDRVKTAQINWIGKSVGVEIDFETTTNDVLKIFTTRPDTLFGATFMVVSPEHQFIEKHKQNISNYDEVLNYINIAKTKTEIERTDLTKDKTGVKLEGVMAINPVTNQTIEIWISDYVLVNYGTGAIMAVPAHDERDYDFAKKYNIEIKYIIKPKSSDIDESQAYTEEGTYINSEFLNEINNLKEAFTKMTEHLKNLGVGIERTNYKLQDWIFSRQRFWGEPIPMINCSDCGWVPVPYEDLPVTLPEVAYYEPTDDGESPLANIESWVNVKCPKCNKDAKRETDTMPNWAGSSWYWLRYMDPNNSESFVGKEALNYWNMVDYYNGGMEHATRHLLYARFWHRFFHDIGLIPFKEPFKKRVAHGMILGENGEKMSKSKGNVVVPDEMIKLYGADALRTYELFIGDYEKDSSWSDNGLKGCKRFLDKVYRLKGKIKDIKDNEFEILINKTIKKVSEDLLNLKYNTAVSSLMILTNALEKKEIVSKNNFEVLITLLHPIAPHITEELNQLIGNENHLAQTSWPNYDESKIVEESITIGVQINGKLRGEVTTTTDMNEEEILNLVYTNDKITNYLTNKKIVKKIIIPQKIVNLVVVDE